MGVSDIIPNQSRFFFFFNMITSLSQPKEGLFMLKYTAISFFFFFTDERIYEGIPVHGSVKGHWWERSWEGGGD